MDLPKPTFMQTSPAMIQTGKACSAVRAPSAVSGLLKQFSAHLFAIYHGLRLSSRALYGTRKIDAVTERRKLSGLFRRYLAMLSAQGMFEVHYSGFDEAPDWHGSVIAANHPSLLDAVLLISVLPEVDCIMNSRLLRDPVTSGATKLCGYIRNDSRFSMVREACNTLSSGSNLLVFPEGTRTTAFPVGPFRHGYALAAARCAAPVRTVFIECDSDYFGSSFRFFRPAYNLPIRFKVSTGPIFHPQKNEDPRILSSKIHSLFSSSLELANGTLRRTP